MKKWLVVLLVMFASPAFAAWSDIQSGDAWSSIRAKLNTLGDTRDSLVTLSGVAESEPDLGTFTGGTTIPDDSTIKAALQALETEVETKEDADTNIIKVSEVDTQAEFEALLFSINAGAVYQSDCSGITEGFCVDTDDSTLYFYDGDSVEVVAGSGGISHATSDDSYYTSRNGAWVAIDDYMVPVPTADNQVLQSTGASAGAYSWTSTIEGLIDDTATNGDTDAIWSADKVYDQLALKINSSALNDSATNGDTDELWSADKVYDQLALKANLADPVFTSSLALPNGASPTVDGAGEIAVDTTSDQLAYYGAAKRVLTYKKQIDFAVKTPVDADDFLLFKAQTGITVTDIHVIAQGGTSISVDIQECTSAGASCATVDAAITADTDGAEDDGTLSNAAIDAGDWVKVVLGAPSGTVNYLAGSIYYVETAD